MGEEIAMPLLLEPPRRIRYRVFSTSRRKTIGLRVHPDGTVEVRAPNFLKQTQVRRFVAARTGWISNRQSYFRDLLAKHPPKELKNGETFPLLGRSHRLRLESRPGLEKAYCKVEARRLKVFFDDKTGGAGSATVLEAIREWYSSLTERKVQAVIRKHSKSLAVIPGKLKISDQAKRWASCSEAGDIRCNWRLSMMPMPVLEYVVVHELCHLKTHDHSPRFWRTVGSVLPDFEKRRDWLKKQGGPLVAMLDLRDR